ncbi:hypothetical protein [Occallatibacter riparius]|uniref:Tetratricopeptide repeat protein n=1 Tax=Occallatibacter riparius TaxID=1002689 RepID=A0A9J7BGP6_9BACT|nr:hypothetical protein [Occallatibacter riparius]UWZ81919.1 hypothetical protein MOP44_15175 [Occallatibacter riparius]
MGRSIRTVQRWHEEHGLPIQRIGNTSGSVFAYTHELDAWLRQRAPADHGNAPSTLSHAPIPFLKAFAADSSPAEDRSVIPERSRLRSAELVALSRMMWRDLSFRNLESITSALATAIEFDCTNAAAYAGLASAVLFEALLGPGKGETRIPTSRAALERALGLDPALPEAMLVSALLKVCVDRHWESARGLLESAQSDLSLLSRIQVAMGLLALAEGQVEQAACCFREAGHKNPLNALWNEFDCWGVYLTCSGGDALRSAEESRSMGRRGPLIDSLEALAWAQTLPIDHSVERLEQLTLAHPDNAVVLGSLGYAYAASKQVDSAREVIDLLQQPRTSQQNHYAIAIVQTGLEQTRPALERLTVSYREGSLWSLAFWCDPILQTLRWSPGYDDFLRECSMAPPPEDAVVRDSAQLAVVDRTAH